MLQMANKVDDRGIVLISQDTTMNFIANSEKDSWQDRKFLGLGNQQTEEKELYGNRRGSDADCSEGL